MMRINKVQCSLAIFTVLLLGGLQANATSRISSVIAPRRPAALLRSMTRICQFDSTLSRPGAR